MYGKGFGKIVDQDNDAKTTKASVSMDARPGNAVGMAELPEPPLEPPLDPVC
jgi:hypothetical protein